MNRSLDGKVWMKKGIYSPNEVHEMEGGNTVDPGGARELLLPRVTYVACLGGSFLLRI